MSKPSFIVTATHPKKGAFSQIWHTSEPLTLGHPFQWILERTSTGVRLRNLQAPLDQIQTNAIQEISEKIIQNGKVVQIESETDSYEIRILPLQTLAPAFQPNSELEEKALGIPSLRIFTCVGHWIQNTQALTSRFVATVHGKDVFTLAKKKGGYMLKTHCEGISIVNGSSQSLEKGKAFPISLEALSSHSIQFETLSWHFNFVQVPTLSNAQKFRKKDKEGIWFRKVLGSVLGLLFAFTIVVSLIPKPEVKEEELIPPQFAQIILKQPKSATPEAAETKGDQQPPVTKAKDAALVQAFRAKALQSAVSGLLKGGLTTLLAQSDLVSGDASKKARTIFDGKTKGLESTAEMTSMTNSRAVAVNVAGDKGSVNGTGYGKGERAGVSGQGSNFVALDTGGASVDSGLSKDEVGKVIHSHMSEIRYCYESSMIQMPDIQGKIMVNFTIGGNGVVRTASVAQSSTEFPRLDDCVIRRLTKWLFPKPKGGVTVAVSYPFIFKKLGR